MNGKTHPSDNFSTLLSEIVCATDAYQKTTQTVKQNSNSDRVKTMILWLLENAESINSPGNKTIHYLQLCRRIGETAAQSILRFPANTSHTNGTDRLTSPR